MTSSVGVSSVPVPTGGVTSVSVTGGTVSTGATGGTTSSVGVLPVPVPTGGVLSVSVTGGTVSRGAPVGCLVGGRVSVPVRRAGVTGGMTVTGGSRVAGGDRRGALVGRRRCRRGQCRSGGVSSVPVSARGASVTVSGTASGGVVPVSVGSTGVTGGMTSSVVRRPSRSGVPSSVGVVPESVEVGGIGDVSVSVSVGGVLSVSVTGGTASGGVVPVSVGSTGATGGMTSSVGPLPEPAGTPSSVGVVPESVGGALIGGLVARADGGAVGLGRGVRSAGAVRGRVAGVRRGGALVGGRRRIGRCFGPRCGARAAGCRAVGSLVRYHQSGVPSGSVVVSSPAGVSGLMIGGLRSRPDGALVGGCRRTSGRRVTGIAGRGPGCVRGPRRRSRVVDGTAVWSPEPAVFVRRGVRTGVGLIGRFRIRCRVVRLAVGRRVVAVGRAGRVCGSLVGRRVVGCRAVALVGAGAFLGVGLRRNGVGVRGGAAGVGVFGRVVCGAVRRGVVGVRAVGVGRVGVASPRCRTRSRTSPRSPRSLAGPGAGVRRIGLCGVGVRAVGVGFRRVRIRAARVGLAGIGRTLRGAHRRRLGGGGARRCGHGDHDQHQPAQRGGQDGDPKSVGEQPGTKSGLDARHLPRRVPASGRQYRQLSCSFNHAGYRDDSDVHRSGEGCRARS